MPLEILKVYPLAPKKPRYVTVPENVAMMFEPAGAPISIPL